MMQLKKVVREKMVSEITDKIWTISDKQLINIYGAVIYTLDLKLSDYEDDKDNPEIVREGN